MILQSDHNRCKTCVVFAFGIPWHSCVLRPATSKLPGVVQPCRGASQGAAPGGRSRCLEVKGLQNKYHILLYDNLQYISISIRTFIYIPLSMHIYIDPYLIIPYLYHIYCIPMPYLHNIYILCDSYLILFDSMFDRGVEPGKQQGTCQT